MIFFFWGGGGERGARVHEIFITMNLNDNMITKKLFFFVVFLVFFWWGGGGTKNPNLKSFFFY